MAMFNVLRWFHPMVGCDWHIPVVPPTGPLPFPSPYLVFQIMGNPVSLTKLYTTSVFADSTQSAMCKGSDIGMLIPHIGTFSITIAIEILFSGSKCHFGPSAIVVADQYGAAQNPAAAVGVVVNPNLNCGFPIPTPLDVVAAFNTTQVGMTLGDIMGGLYSMLVDFAFQTIINLLAYKYLGKAVGAVGRRVAPRVGAGALGRAASRRAARAAWKAGGKAGPLSAVANPLRAAATQRNASFLRQFGLWGENLVSFVTGSPLGTASDAPGLGGHPSGYGTARKGLEALGLPTEQSVQQGVDAPSSQPSSSTPSPTGTPSPTPAPAPTPTPTPTPTATPSPAGASEPNACMPDDPVSNYLDDPSVEHIGDPPPP
jgi:hypothetical protein